MGKLLHTEKTEENGETFIIKVYSENPDYPRPKNDEEEEKLEIKTGGHQFYGTHSYAVFHSSDTEIPFYVDEHNIWDVEQALNLAYQDFGEWERRKDTYKDIILLVGEE